MQQTPMHDQYNHDLLALMPLHARRIMEVGCSSGALAHAFKQKVADAHYRGLEIDPDYAAVAQTRCDECVVADIESVGEDFWEAQTDRDCWVFGDTLEHFKDPWAVLRRVRAAMPEGACVVACIPNAQHWSLQARLSVGAWDYADSGLLDRTHLRWFTRRTLGPLFADCGFRIEHIAGRIFNEPQREHFLPIIGQLAARQGVQAEQAMNDAKALQYVLRAVPA